MTILLLVLFVASVSASIAYSLENASTTGLGVVRGFVVGVIVFIGLAVVVSLGRLLLIGS